MKTAIIYTTTYGTTEKVANYIAEKLHYKNIDVVELKHNTDFDVSHYDIVILGASVYLGDIQHTMSNFCKRNLEVLLTKKIGLFICGIEPELVRQDTELEMAFPLNLYNYALATAFVGGEINLEALNASQKFITTSLLGIKESASFIQYDLIDIFINQLQIASE